MIEVLIDDQNTAAAEAIPEPVRSEVRALLQADAASRWLIGSNPRLGGRRPIDLVRAGRTREVLDALADEAAGGYA
jgi:uncharacterized protein (DUF2384 family)